MFFGENLKKGKWMKVFYRRGNRKSWVHWDKQLILQNTTKRASAKCWMVEVRPELHSQLPPSGWNSGSRIITEACFIQEKPTKTNGGSRRRETLQCFSSLAFSVLFIGESSAKFFSWNTSWLVRHVTSRLPNICIIHRQRLVFQMWLRHCW